MSNYDIIGKPLPRIDGRVKATGEALFAMDVSLPGMLHGKILRSPHAHARILRIDTSKAEQLPGVKAIVTAKDTGGIRFAFVDTPGHPADEYPLATGKVRYIGEEVAAVAASDADTAEQAIGLIEVDYQLLPAIFDPEEAMKPGAPAVHDEIIPTTTSAWEDWGAKKKTVPYRVINNICATTNISYGDVEKGFQESDYVREDRFYAPATAHAALEPHVAVASFSPAGSLDVWLTGMGNEMKRFWLAKTMGLPLGKVRVYKTFVGGAFGGKINLFAYEFLAALLSKKAGLPVRIALTREEVFMTGRTSHPMIITVKTGVKRDGALVAQHMKVIADPGAYRGTSPIAMFLTHIFGSPVYRIPNVKHEATAVYTNKSICCPKRGHGNPQARFAVESQLDMIAAELGIDPLELRLKNAREAGDVLPNGDRLNSCGLKEALSRAGAAAGWKEKRGRGNGRGIGMGVAAMFSGSAVYPFGSAAVVRLNLDGTATLFTGQTEFGQGSDTAMAMIAAQELGIRMEDISVVSSDTGLCPIDMGNFLSCGIFVSGEAVRRAAADARRQLLEAAAKLLEVNAADLEIRNGIIGAKQAGSSVAAQADSSVAARRAVPEAHVPGKSLSIADALKAAHPPGADGGAGITGRGFKEALSNVNFAPGISRGAGRFTDAYAFTVVVAEVEVDRTTGRVRIVSVTTADESGFPINRLNLDGQMDGQAVMGVGDALFEDVVREEGRMMNPSFADYRIPSFKDMPELTSIHVEAPDPGGPYGAKEGGECSRSAVIPAIANAIADAVGIRLNTLPFSPEKVLAAL
ncbi:MAG: molybdopterin-dependent oxidoreductase, partial [Armatimonadetes bacterium]|nr:molybdopterin-dependent oxidoreductase [Armatimonadota bacterium]